MNSADKEKDFIDEFFSFLEPYKKAKVRFVATIVSFVLVFLLGMFFAPFFISWWHSSLPFDVEFLQISPVEVMYNYVKFALFFSLFLNFPFFLYQFGKFKINFENIEEKVSLLYLSLIVFAIFLFCFFLCLKVIFPIVMFVCYGFNFSVVTYSTSISGIVSAFITTLLLVYLAALLPVVRFLIKKSLFFNYATLVQARKPIIIYLIAITIFITLPIEIIVPLFIFLLLFLWYKVIVNFSKKRD